jgi:hypothetical protein
LQLRLVPRPATCSLCQQQAGRIGCKLCLTLRLHAGQHRQAVCCYHQQDVGGKPVHQQPTCKHHHSQQRLHKTLGATRPCTATALAAQLHGCQAPRVAPLQIPLYRKTTAEDRSTLSPEPRPCTVTTRTGMTAGRKQALSWACSTAVFEKRVPQPIDWPSARCKGKSVRRTLPCLTLKGACPMLSVGAMFELSTKPWHQQSS